MDNTIYRPVVNSITDKDWEYYLSFSPWKFIQITSESLKNSNRFFVDERFTKLIFWFIFGQESRYEAQHLVRPNQCLYRARIYDNTNVLTDNKSTKDASFRGYNKIGSFVPTDASKTPAGRANPENIIYLCGYPFNSAEQKNQQLRLGAPEGGDQNHGVRSGSKIRQGKKPSSISSPLAR